MSRNRIEDFGPYQDAVRLFDHVVEDMQILRNDTRCYRLIGQLTTTINTLRANNVAAVARHATSNADPSPRATPAVPGVHELAAAYGTQATPDPDVLVRDEIEQLLALTHSENTP